MTAIPICPSSKVSVTVIGPLVWIINIEDTEPEPMLIFHMIIKCGFTTKNWYAYNQFTNQTCKSSKGAFTYDVRFLGR